MEAAQQAISSARCSTTSRISGATGVLVNITGGADLTLGEVHQINEIIHDAVGDDAEIIFGAVHEPAMQGEIRVTVIATGFDKAVQPGSHAGARRAGRSRAEGRAGDSVPAQRRPARVGGSVPPRPRDRAPTSAASLRAVTAAAAARIAGSQRHGDPDLHSETDGLKHVVALAPRTYAVRGAPARRALRFTPELPERRRAPASLRGDRAVDSAIRAAARARVGARAPTRSSAARRSSACSSAPASPTNGARSRARRDRVRASNTRYLRAGMPVDVTLATAPTQSPRELVFQLGDRPPAAPACAPTRGWAGSEEKLPGRPTRSSSAGRSASNLYEAIDAAAAPYFPGARAGRAGVGARRHLRVPRRHEPRPPAGRRVPRRSSSGGRARRARRAWARCSPRRSRCRAASVEAIRFDSRSATRELLRPERASRCAPRSCARRSSSAASRASSACAATRSSAAGGAQGHRLRRVVGHAGARDRRRRGHRARAGRAATATCSRSATATAS